MDLHNQLKAIELQLEVLKALIQRRLPAPVPAPSFASLRGILDKEPRFTEEEISSALYQPTALITKDTQITASKLVPTDW